MALHIGLMENRALGRSGNVINLALLVELASYCYLGNILRQYGLIDEVTHNSTQNKSSERHRQGRVQHYT